MVIARCGAGDHVTPAPGDWCDRFVVAALQKDTSGRAAGGTPRDCVPFTDRFPPQN